MVGLGEAACRIGSGQRPEAGIFHPELLAAGVELHAVVQLEIAIVPDPLSLGHM